VSGSSYARAFTSNKLQLLQMPGARMIASKALPKEEAFDSLVPNRKVPRIGMPNNL
jgi:hypothetical protein